MPIQITCSCGQSLRAPDTAAGKVLTCPTCSKPIKIPAAAAQTAPANSTPAKTAPRPQSQSTPRQTPKAASANAQFDPFSAELPPTADPFSLNQNAAPMPAANQYWQQQNALNQKARKSQKATGKFPLWILGLIGGVTAGIVILVVIVVVAIQFSYNSNKQSRTVARNDVIPMDRPSSSGSAGSSNPTGPAVPANPSGTSNSSTPSSPAGNANPSTPVNPANPSGEANPPGQSNISGLPEPSVPAPSVPEEPQFEGSPQAELTGLTEDECQPVAEQYVHAVSNNDVVAFGQCYDVVEMLRYAFSEVPMADSSKERLVNQLKESFMSRTLQIYQQRANYGTKFSVLRMKPVDDEMHAIIQMVDGDTLVGYDELIFGRRKDNQVVIVDVYSYIYGERNSEDQRSGMIESMAVSQSAVFYGKGPSRQDYEKIRSLRHQYTSNPREALSIYETLHEDFKSRKEVQVLRAQAASRVDEATFLGVYEEFRKTYPDDPSIDLRSMEFFSQRGKGEKLAETLEHLNTAVGGDPLLENLLENVQSSFPKASGSKKPKSK